MKSGDRIDADEFRRLARTGRVRAKRGKTTRERKPKAAPIEYTIAEQCARSGLPAPIAEHRFHPKRRWLIDWAWPESMIALEIEGGAFTQGRHTRGAGYVKDMEKYSEMALLGWLLIRVTPKQAEDGTAIALLTRAFASRTGSECHVDR